MPVKIATIAKIATPTTMPAIGPAEMAWGSGIGMSVVGNDTEVCTDVVETVELELVTVIGPEDEIGSVENVVELDADAG
jgi:hypothetical protein